MPPHQRKKSVAQKPASAEQPATTPLHDPKNFERYKLFSERRVFQPYILSLDVAKHFGIRDEVEELVSLPKWKYLLMGFQEDTYTSVLVEVMTTMKLPKFDGLTCSPCMQFHVGHTMFIFSPDEISDLMGFGPIHQLTEEERDNRVTKVGNTQAFWEELKDGTTEFSSSHNRSVAFIKKEHRFMQYVLSHSVCGRYDATSSVNHANMLCLYGMVKRVRLHMGVVIWNLFKNQYQPWPLTAEAVERMRDKIGAKRARTAAATDVRMEEEAYDAHPDAVGHAHVGAGEGSSSRDFQQQVFAQLAAMNTKGRMTSELAARFVACCCWKEFSVDGLEPTATAASCHRMSPDEEENLSRDEARAYYEWMRGHYPPPGALNSHSLIPHSWDDMP
nr:hypothetical protein Iba_chr04dCG13330 [Ipomoea batatas]